MQWNAVASIVHTGNKNKGLWEDKDALMALLGCGKTNVKLACIMLIVTELSEAVENIRHREMPDDKIPEFTGLEAELADAVIRIMDLGHCIDDPAQTGLCKNRLHN